MNCPSFFACNDKTCVLGLIAGDKKNLLQCLGDKLEELDPSKAEGAGEKHLPDVKVNGAQITVNIGSVPHPMTIDHSIGWVYLETKQGGQIKFLCPTDAPTVQFELSADDKAVAAYAYCNLHGFWKTTI